MNKEERNVIEFIVTEMLQNAVSNEYAKAILSHKDESTGNTFMENVIRDVLENSAWKDTGHYSVSDVKFAIGRAIMRNLEGRGNCKDIKEFAVQLKEQDNDK